MRRCLPLASVLVVLAFALPGPASAAQRPPTLRAGAGEVDITPPQTGYFLGGWTLAYRTAQGQSTRLLANTLVLQRGGQNTRSSSIALPWRSARRTRTSRPRRPPGATPRSSG